VENEVPTNPKQSQLESEICGDSNPGADETSNIATQIRSCFKIGDEGQLITVRIGGVWFTLLLDTGSEVSLISPSAFKRLDHSITLNPVDLSLEAVNGTSCPVHGLFRAPMVVSDEAEARREEFLVADIEKSFEVDGILGLDIIKLGQGIIDFENQKIRLNGVWINTFQAKTTVMVAENSHLLPRSVSYVKVVIPQSKQEISPVLIEPHPEVLAANGLLMAKCVVNSGDFAHVAMINATNKPVVLPLGRIVADSEQVNSYNLKEVQNCDKIRGGSKGSNTIPTHLLDLYERSKAELNPPQ
jgi:hypothetical protein